jgi:hypothetical protein
MDNTDSTIASAQLTSTPSKTWRPVRPITIVDTSGDQIQKLQRQVANINGTTASITAAVTSATTAPDQVYAVSGTVSPYKSPTGMKSLVAINFTPAGNFALAAIWFTGYGGSSTPQLMSQGYSSPVEFLAETTGETVTVTVVAINSDGVSADFSSAPTILLTLSSTGTAPPAPTINQTIVALPGSAGWQFSWNVLNGLLNDIISGYWVYRSSSPTTPNPPASRVQFFPQPATNIGVMTFQDYISGTQYYWVSAVSVSGLESALTPASTTSVTSSAYPTSYSGSFSNPTQAYDGNETSAATADFTTAAVSGDTNSASETWSGWAAWTGGTIGHLTLDVMADAYVRMNADAALLYSLDGGTTWTTLFSIFATYPSGSLTASVMQQYFSVVLSNSQNFTLVRVRASCEATTYDDYTRPTVIERPSTATVNIYEARLTVAHS